ncbi:hypothetical protein D3C80_1650450 [compost metagenome]
MIERGVMRHHDRAIAIAVLHPFTHHFIDGVQRVIFAYRAAQGVMRIDAVKSQRFGLKIGAFERINMEM